MIVYDHRASTFTVCSTMHCYGLAVYDPTRPVFCVKCLARRQEVIAVNDCKHDGSPSQK